MPKFLLEIKIGDAAMRTGTDVAEALEEAATALRAHGYLRDRDAVRVGIRDLNGNTVGHWEVLAS